VLTLAIRPCLTVLLLALSALALPACGAADLVDDLISEEKDVAPGEQMTADERGQALRVAQLVNQVRAENGLEPLIWDEVAADAAYDHAVDMRQRSFYTHTNPDGLTPLDRMERAQVDMSWFGGENIARGNDGPDAVMAAWMNSPGHRSSVLAPGFTHIGVGLHDGAGGPWWVQEFFIKIED